MAAHCKRVFFYFFNFFFSIFYITFFSKNYFYFRLCISGPPGSGKTSALRSIAAKQGVQVLEWIAPSSHALLDASARTAAGTERDASELDLFQAWLRRAAGFATLDIVASRVSTLSLGSGASAQPRSAAPAQAPQRTVLLIEDLPYLHGQEQHQKFLSSLRSFVARGTCPAALIVCDTHIGGASSSMRLLIPPDLHAHPNVSHCKFNPINDTLMRKTLKEIAKKEVLKRKEKKN